MSRQQPNLPNSRGRARVGNPNELIPLNRGRGQIDITKDYSSGFTSLRSKIIYLTCCALPYIGFCTFLYMEGLKSACAVMVIVPIALFAIFWFLKRKLM